MSQPDMKSYLHYGVELFKYHADQRLRCIRYYIFILVACIAGTVQFVMIDNPPSLLLIITSLCVISGITLFFLLIDIRNRVLTECAEKGLKKAEETLFIYSCNLPTLDLCIIHQGENKEKAWHYGSIVPVFFLSVMVLTIGAAFLLICFYDINIKWHDYFLPEFLISFHTLFLAVGCYAEGRFIKKKDCNKDTIFTRFVKGFYLFWKGKACGKILIIAVIVAPTFFLILIACRSPDQSHYKGNEFFSITKITPHRGEKYIIPAEDGYQDVNLSDIENLYMMKNDKEIRYFLLKPIIPKEVEVLDDSTQQKPPSAPKSD